MAAVVLSRSCHRRTEEAVVRRGACRSARRRRDRRLARRAVDVTLQGDPIDDKRVLEGHLDRGLGTPIVGPGRFHRAAVHPFGAVRRRNRAAQRVVPARDTDRSARRLPARLGGTPDRDAPRRLQPCLSHAVVSSSRVLGFAPARRQAESSPGCTGESSRCPTELQIPRLPGGTSRLNAGGSPDRSDVPRSGRDAHPAARRTRRLDAEDRHAAPLLQVARHSPGPVFGMTPEHPVRDSDRRSVA